MSFEEIVTLCGVLIVGMPVAWVLGRRFFSTPLDPAEPRPMSHARHRQNVEFGNRR